MVPVAVVKLFLPATVQMISPDGLANFHSTLLGMLFFWATANTSAPDPSVAMAPILLKPVIPPLMLHVTGPADTKALSIGVLLGTAFDGAVLRTASASLFSPKTMISR